MRHKKCSPAPVSPLLPLMWFDITCWRRDASWRREAAADRQANSTTKLMWNWWKEIPPKFTTESALDKFWSNCSSNNNVLLSSINKLCRIHDIDFYFLGIVVIKYQLLLYINLFSITTQTALVPGKYRTGSNTRLGFYFFWVSQSGLLIGIGYYWRIINIILI